LSCFILLSHNTAAAAESCSDGSTESSVLYPLHYESDHAPAAVTMKFLFKRTPPFTLTDVVPVQLFSRQFVTVCARYHASFVLAANGVPLSLVRNAIKRNGCFTSLGNERCVNASCVPASSSSAYPVLYYLGTLQFYTRNKLHSLCESPLCG